MFDIQISCYQPVGATRKHINLAAFNGILTDKQGQFKANQASENKTKTIYPSIFFRLYKEISIGPDCKIKTSYRIKVKIFCLVTVGYQKFRKQRKIDFTNLDKQ